MISSEQNCWVFALEQKKREKKPFGSLPQKLYCSLVHNSNHKSLRRILDIKAADFGYLWSCYGREKNRWFRLNKTIIHFRAKKKKKTVWKSATKAVLLSRSKFKSQEYNKSMSRILNAKAAGFVFLGKRRKIDDFVRQNCVEYLF